MNLKKKRKIVFIGPVSKGKKPTGGAVAKNKILYDYFCERYSLVTLIDTTNWKKSFLPFYRIIKSLIIHRKRIFIISVNTNSAYLLSRVLYYTIKPKQLYYFVIGNTIENSLRSGKFIIDFYKIYSRIFFESNKTCDYFLKKGLNNVSYLPNLKRIRKQVNINDKNFPKSKDKIQFVFLSRIIPEKGVELIIDAVKNLNVKIGYTTFDVTFFGPIDIEYKNIFKSRINGIENISYGGFLDFNDDNSYIVLANYDVMLFPTYWYGEGFPGVIIDASISYLPIIASDWSINREFIVNGENGFIIKHKSVSHLIDRMTFFIRNPSEIEKMSINSNNRAKLYDVNTNLNKYF